MPRRIPEPGTPASRSRSGRPMMALIDLIGHRWVLRIVWELRGEPLTFRALQQACGGLSPSVLNQRLGELRDTGLIHAHSEQGYALTGLGRELLMQLLPLAAWAEKWAKVTRSD